MHISLSPCQLEEVELALAEAETDESRKRLDLLLVAARQSGCAHLVEHLAYMFRVSPSTVYRWLRSWQLHPSLPYYLATTVRARPTSRRVRDLGRKQLGDGRNGSSAE